MAIQIDGLRPLVERTSRSIMSLEASQQQGEAEQGQRGRDELSRDAESPNVQAIPTVKVRFKPRVGVPVTRDVSKSFEQNVSIITTTEVALLGFSTVDKNGHAIEEIELELKSKGTSAIFFSETFKVVAPEAVSSGPPIALGHDGFVTLYGNQHPAHFCLAEKGTR